MTERSKHPVKPEESDREKDPNFTKAEKEFRPENLFSASPR